MPHVKVHHFAPGLTCEQKEQLATKITDVIISVMGCHADVVSVALHPVQKENWHDEIYVPEILQASRLLCKKPNY